MLQGSSCGAVAASARPRRSSGNSNGLGNADPSGTTSRDIEACMTSNTRSLTSTLRDSPSGREACSGSGGCAPAARVT